MPVGHCPPGELSPDAPETSPGRDWRGVHPIKKPDHRQGRSWRLSENIAAAKECRCEFLLHPGYPSLYNDDTVTPLLADALRAGGIHAVSSPPIMAAEDFAYYAKERPSTYFNVGTGAPGKTQSPAHNARFDIQEEAMAYAMEATLIAYDELTRGKAADLLRKNH